MKDRFSRVDGLMTRVLHAGGSGPAVMLVHGGGMSADVFVHNVDALGNNHRVLAVDLPGCGFTEPTDGPVLAACVAHLLAVADAEGISSFAMVGSSLGAQVAVLVALATPARISALVLTPSASAFLGGTGLSKALLDTRRSDTSAVDGERDVGELADEMSLLAPGSGRRLRRVLISQATSQARPGHSASFRWLIDGLFDPVQRDRFAVSDRLSEVGAPTLVLWGRRDPRVSLTEAVPAIRRLPAHRLIVFRRSGHLPFLEQPHRFNRIVGRFLNSPAALIGAPLGRATARRAARNGGQTHMSDLVHAGHKKEESAP